jgi:hypothetical protein
MLKTKINRMHQGLELADSTPYHPNGVPGIVKLSRLGT